MARTTALPFHPSKRHPRTGEPLRALWVRPDGRACWPIIGAAEDDEGAQAAADAAQAAADAAAANAPAFPANTPVSEMKPEEQVAYWQDKARKHEGRVKAFGKLTPEELATLRDKATKHDELEHERSSETDKATRAASDKAKQDADALYRPMLAETAFRVAIGDRKTQDEVDDFIADLNLSRFLNDDGRVDTAKVLSRVEQFAPAKGTQQQRGPLVPSHGSGNGAGTRRATLSNLSGSELYDRLHPKKDA